MEQIDTISIEDRTLINCILSTRTMTDAAKCAKISRATLYRRLDDPTFKMALDGAKADVLANLTDELERLSLASVRRLWSYIEDETAEDKIVIRACGLALVNAIRYRETADLQKRLEALENALKNSK